MMRLASLFLCALPLLAACGSEDVTVGSQSAALTKKKDGSPTGDGTTCSWSDTAAYDAVSSNGTTAPSGPGRTYAIGDQFKSLDACNDCSCTEKGIMCTLRACSTDPDPGGEPVACPTIAKECPDGSYVGPSGPDCAFVCPNDPPACTEEARQCPDGKTWVSRTGPKCEFAACP